MVYFGKKKYLNDMDQLEQEIHNLNENAAFKNKQNTFAQANTFSGAVTINNENFKAPRIMNCGTDSDGDFYILPRTNNKRTLRFGNSPNNDNKRYDLNMESRSKITNLPTPTANGDAANKQYVDRLNPNLVYITTMNNLSFTRQVLEQGKVTKYYSRDIAYTSISGASNVSKVISIALENIPVVGQHLVVTQFVKRNNGILVEIYQYQNDTDITNQLNSATFQIAYTKG